MWKVPDKRYSHKKAENLQIWNAKTSGVLSVSSVWHNRFHESYVRNGRKQVDAPVKL